MQSETEANGLVMTQLAADLHRRRLDRARARQAQVAAKPDAQAWEVEHARRSLAEAENATGVHTLALAVAQG